MKYRFIIISSIVLFCVIFVSGTYLFVPFGNHNRKMITVHINNGDGLNTIARKLEKHGLVSHAVIFKWISFFFGKRRSYKSGEYRINDRISIISLIDLIDKGRTALISVTIPEGHRILEIVTALQQKGFMNLDSFIALCSDQEFIRAFNIGANVSSLEGFLFPETYKFSKTESDYTILKTMIKTFLRNIPENYEQLAKRVGLTYYEAVILASIIEKETSVSSERRIISSVFHNRITKKMRLQTDPTVIYGIKNFDGNLTKRQLRTKNPYNTYIVEGLPPTPICNPGLASLMAAVQPAPTSYLFFVAKGDGTHQFTTNYRDHYRWVRKFQKSRRTNYRSF